MQPRLGINIDHVATLRQARGENYPSVVTAADQCFLNGADQITIHLREDRRHIQDFDVDAVRLVTKKFGKPLNLEMGCHREIIDIAIATSPDWICLVPENRQEQTTEGGLNLLDDTVFNKIKETCHKLKEEIKNVKISLFLEANTHILERVSELNIDAVEIHTGDYARLFLDEDNYVEAIEEFKNAKTTLDSLGVACHAGHGLTFQSVIPLLETGIFKEYNIGHSVICQAVFEGLGNVVKSYSNLFEKYTC